MRPTGPSPDNQTAKVLEECGDHLGTKSFKPKKWPADLKKLLGKTLQSLPVHAEILKFASGIYLVDTSQDMIDAFEDALRNAQQNL